MSTKIKKPYQSDKIFVKGKQQAKKAVSMDDIGLLALQISCPYRSEIKSDDLSGNSEPLGDFFCINIETRTTSAIVFIGTYDDIEVDEVVNRLKDQMFNVIKSSNEKIYFIEVVKIKMTPVPFVEILTHFGEYTFLWQMPNVDMVVSYIKLEKKMDSEKFESVDLNKLGEEVSQVDLYLHFPRNNRYIHYVKKGVKLEKIRKDRLTQKGVKNLFSPKDQPLDRQRKRSEAAINNLLARFAAEKKPA
jgi:hypothetical protein